jgi:hypothetical protein
MALARDGTAEEEQVLLAVKEGAIQKHLETDAPPSPATASHRISSSVFSKRQTRLLQQTRDPILVPHLALAFS